MQRWLETDGKGGKAPDGNLILMIAERYHQPPQEVEHWDAYWINRIATWMQAESLEHKRRIKR